MRIDYASNYREAERDSEREPTADGLLRLLTALDLAGDAPVPTGQLLAATGLRYSDLQMTLAVLEGIDAVEVERAAPGGPAATVRLKSLNATSGVRATA